jgi:D-3-phosphoglycerate dehydrogenase
VGQASGGDLGLIARYGVGYDSVDTEAAAEFGVLVANTPGANSMPTAEWAVATLLDVCGRRIPHHERASRGQSKSGPSRLDISGRTLGVIGTGNIGRRVISLLSGFNLEVLACDLYPDEDWARKAKVSYVSLQDLCRRSDFITIHAAAKDRIIGAEELALMRPTSVLINCARGVHVDNRAAYEAVRDGRLYGYGIDEIWPEPDLELAGLNIATSPHVGSDTDRGKAAMREGSARAVVEFMRGTTPQNTVNRPS